MENKYNRPILQISYWCVSLENIKAIFDFFEKRVNESRFKSVNLEAHFMSGNNIRVEKIEDFLNEIKSRIEEKEDLASIEMQDSYHGFLSDGMDGKYYKDLFLRINFDHNSTEFEVGASDSDGSLKDWVDGTYEEMKRIKSRFEMEEKYRKHFCEKVENKDTILKDYLIFDPFGEIKKEIIGEFKLEEKMKKQEREDKKNTPSAITIINGNNKFFNNKNVSVNDSFNCKNWQRCLQFFGIKIID